MKLFVIFAAFICLANAKEEAKQPTVAEKAFKALKAIQGDLFTVADTNAYNQKENDDDKKKVREAFAKKFDLEGTDEEALEDLIKTNPTLIDNLIDAAKAADANALKTKMNSNANLEKAVKLIAKSKPVINSASAIGMSGLLVFSLLLLH